MPALAGVDSRVVSAILSIRGEEGCVRIASTVAAVALFACALAAHGTDTYGPAASELQIPSLRTGAGTYSAVVLSIGSVVSGPSGSSPKGTQDSYDPANDQLTVPAVLVGNTTYYNAVATVAQLTSIGSVSGADTFDGTHLTIPYVLVGAVPYYNVTLAVSIANVVALYSGMPSAAEDQYDLATGRLTIPAVQAGPRVYTNVILHVVPGDIVSAGITESVLYSFGTFSSGDGYDPKGSQGEASDGNFYGLVTFGGAHGEGAVVRIHGCGAGGGVLLPRHQQQRWPIPRRRQPDPGQRREFLWADERRRREQDRGGDPDHARARRIGAVLVRLVRRRRWRFADGQPGRGERRQLLRDDAGRRRIRLRRGDQGHARRPRVGAVVLRRHVGRRAWPRRQPDPGQRWKFLWHDERRRRARPGCRDQGHARRHGVGAYSFGTNAGDGTRPYGSLIQASDGNLYGMTQSGGASGNGAIVRITLGGTESVLYSLGSQGNDGLSPYGSLIQASDGNFYGMTRYGGANGAGAVMRITPAGNASVLHSFAPGGDGSNPQASLIQASDGNLYGLALSGGLNNTGAVIRINW